jgi:hypothetical protein
VGSGTTIEYVEVLNSSDDGLMVGRKRQHRFGGGLQRMMISTPTKVIAAPTNSGLGSSRPGTAVRQPRF